MKNRYKYILSLFLLLIGVFLVGKIVFMLYNQSIESLTVGKMFFAWLHGLPLDIRTTAIALLVPTLCSLSTRNTRFILIPYFILLAIVIGIIIMADTIMYEFWEFKLSSVVLSYAASPEGTTNSVSVSFLVVRLFAMLAFILLVAVPAIWITPKRFNRNGKTGIILPIALACLPVDVSSCYHEGSLFQSHAATNPIYRFATSFFDDKHYDSLNEEVCDNYFQQLYPTLSDENMTDTLLNTDRPNVLVVMVESFGGKFVEELGGIPNVAPELSRLIPEGIFWDQYYSNSFRTDRGTVCTFSGTISYPTVSPMKQVELHDQLPSLARSFHNAGYKTGYLYGGAMTNMGKRQYLSDMGFESLMDDTFFTEDEINSSWGANDSTSAMKTYHVIAETDTASRWFMGYQTLSSHEPWVVPYHRLEDKRLNAFAYTDHCLGQLVDSLRTLPAWENMLVIIIPDHGFLYEQTYDDPEFFHSPMLWLGGAVKEPKCIHTLMNQSDIAATLLAQMGLKHEEYPYSRNILSADYKPFVYCSYPAGFLFKEETGETLFDLSARMPIPVGKPTDAERLTKGQAILQASYKNLHK